jgi:cytidylate kinase
VISASPLSKNLITISGDIGSGKSAVGKAVAAALGFDYMSSGAIQREEAAARNMTILELNQFAETHPEIDYAIDDRIAHIGRTGEKLLIDSRMAWHFVPHSFKVFLVTEPAIAAQRIMAALRKNESYTDLAHAVEEIKARRASESKRFMQFYGVDLTDQSQFDLVIDTSNATIEAEVAVVKCCFEAWQKTERFERLWFFKT